MTALIRGSLGLVAVFVGLHFLQASSAHAAAFVPTEGPASWNVATNWSPESVPDSIGASAVFETPTAARTVTLDAPITAGVITFDNNSSFTNALTDGAGGPLTLGAADSGATITASGTGTGLSSVSATMTWPATLTVNVTNIVGLSTAAGSALSLTGSVNGPGGLTKTGEGVLTIAAIPGSTNATKLYTGPTLVSAGRLRFSPIGAPLQSSSVTVASGGQLFLIPSSASSDFTFGTSSLMLNGLGLPAAGPFAATSEGALRFDPSPTAQTGQILWTSSNPLILASNAGIFVGQNNTDLASFTASNSVSGAGGLVKTGTGNLILLSGNNTYSGGTTVQGGAIFVEGSAGASLGAGNVTVESGAVKLTIQTGVTNAIANTATLTLAGGGLAGSADSGFAELASGVNEVVGGLVLGTVAQAFGTYGSTLSGAAIKNDEYFSGAGIVTVIPEPGAAVVLLGSFSTLVGLQRFRRRNHAAFRQRARLTQRSAAPVGRTRLEKSKTPGFTRS